MTFTPDRRTGIAVIAGSFLFIVAILVGTFGAPTDFLFDEEPVVVIEAYNGPNGEQYVTFEEDDQLRIDISQHGLNPGARTTIRQLFNITNQDDREVSIWLSHNSTDSVIFYNDRTGARIDMENNEVVLQPGDRIVVSMVFDTTQSSPGDDLLTLVTVNARFDPGLPFFDIVETNVGNEAVAGETITLETTIQNTGDGSGNQTVQFLANGSAVDSREVKLDSGEQTTLTFEYQTTNDDIGTLDLEVVTADEIHTTNVTVLEGAFFDLTLGTVPDSITSADTLSLDVTVENVGEQTDSQTIEFVVNGSVVDQTTVELAGGASETITLEWSPGLEGIGDDIPITVRGDDEALTDNISVTPTVVAEGSASSYVVATGTEVEFNANRSHIPPNSNPTYSWELDGDPLADGKVTRTTFDSPGDHEVSLTVTASGMTDTDTLTISVVDSTEPTARISAADTILLGESISLDGSSSTDNVEIQSYAWDFGDGTTNSGSALTSPTHDYNDPGRYRVTLTVTDTSGNDHSTRHRVEVLGPDGSLSTSDLTFGEIGIGSSDSMVVELSNEGTANLNLSTIEITGDSSNSYSLVGDAESGSMTVRPGETKSIGVQFGPTTAGSLSATLEIDSNNPVAFDPIPISGTGIEGTVDPVQLSVEYGSVLVGTSESAQVSFENTGDGDVELEGASISGRDGSMFEVVSGDQFPITLSPGETHSITVDFSPTVSGDRVASLSVSTSDESAGVSLRGSGEAPAIHISPDDLEFPTIGKSDWTEDTITITNYGNHDLEIDSVAVTGEDAEHFEVRDDNLPNAIPPGESATFDLRFDPQAAGEHDATLAIESNDPATPTLETPVTGPAVAADIGIDRRTVDFGEVTIGETVYMTVTVKNKGESLSDLSIDETRIVSDEEDAFNIHRGDAPVVLAPGESHEIEVAFQPLTQGTKDAQLQILSDAANSPLINVWLSNTRTYIIVQEISNPTVGVEARNLVADDDHGVNVWAPSIDGESAGFSKIGFTTARSGNFDMNLVHDRNPRGPVFEATDLEAIEYVELDHLGTDPDTTFENTSVEYQVTKQNLPSGTGPGDVRLYRWNDDRSEWVDMTERGELVEETDQYYIYHVDTPGFSQFAVTAPTAEDDDSSSGGGSGSGGGGSGAGSGQDDSDGSNAIENPDSLSVLSVEGESLDGTSPEFSVSEVSRASIIELDAEFQGVPPLAKIDARPRDAEADAAEQEDLAGTVITVDGEEVTLDRNSIITTAGSATRLTGERSLVRTADAITAPGNMVAAVDVTPMSAEPDEPVTLRFRIDRNRFPEEMPDTVTVGHRITNGWELLDSEIVSTTGGEVIVETETDSFSVFGIFIEPRVTYDWELPDGTVRSEPAFDHTFDEPGVYPVGLAVTDAFGRQNTTTKRVIANDVPRASIASVSEDSLSDNVTLVADVENSIGDSTVTWTFPDGTERVGTEVTHELAPGDHQVQLHVEDELGASSETTETVGVGPGSIVLSDPLEWLDFGPKGLLLAILIGLLLAIALVSYRRSTGALWAPWGLLSHRGARKLEITRIEDMSLDVAQRRLLIGALTIDDPKGDLDRVTIDVIDSDGQTVVTKQLNIDPATRYAPTDEELIIPFADPIDPVETYSVEITAHGRDNSSDSQSYVDIPMVSLPGEDEDSQ